MVFDDEAANRAVRALAAISNQHGQPRRFSRACIAAGYAARQRTD